MTGWLDGHWLPSHRCDPRAIKLYFDHYSSAKGGRKASVYSHGFVGNGESMVLLTEDCLAVWAWRRQQINDAGQAGCECTIFRNTGPVLSSELVAEADALAWGRWPGERHFTYVDAGAVRQKRDPGRCFIRAGWSRLPERSTRGLVILERVPD